MRERGSMILVAAALVGAVAVSAGAEGSLERGKALYAVCSTCHGERGEGLEEMNAPALAGQEEWYIVRQLQNFKAGIRGADPGDVYGQQMAPMAKVLPDTQAMEDIAAYLSSLAR